MFRLTAPAPEEAQDHSFSLRDSSMQNEMLSRAKYIVDRAVKNRKVRSIKFLVKKHILPIHNI